MRKAYLSTRWAVVTAAFLLGLNGPSYGDGYFRLGAQDVSIAQSSFNPTGTINSGGSAFRLSVAYLPDGDESQIGETLSPQTSFVGNSGTEINPVIVRVPGKEPGEEIAINARIWDGLLEVSRSSESRVTLGTEEQPGTLAELLMFPALELYNGVVPHFLDPTFNPKFTRNGSTNDLRFTGIHSQPDRKIVVAGNFTEVNGVEQSGVVRLLTNGVTDMSFTSVLPSGASVTHSELLPSGGVILAGSFVISNHTHRLIQVGTDGAFERSFTGPISNEVTAVAVQADGSLLIGMADPARLLRILTNGFLDGNWTFPEFQKGTGVAAIHAIEPIGAESIRVGGDFTSMNGQETGSFVQLKADGTIDTTAPSVFVQGPIYAIEGDLIGGAFANINGSICQFIARITATNIACAADAIPNGRPLKAPIRQILQGGALLVQVSGPQGNYVYFSAPFARIGFAANTVGMSGANLIIATPYRPDGQLARLTIAPLGYAKNSLMGLDIYGDFLLLRPWFAWREEFQYSSDLKTWTTVPGKIRDTNVTERARFYRIKPRF